MDLRYSEDLENPDRLMKIILAWVGSEATQVLATEAAEADSEEVIVSADREVSVVAIVTVMLEVSEAAIVSVDLEVSEAVTVTVMLEVSEAVIVTVIMADSVEVVVEAEAPAEVAPVEAVKVAEALEASEQTRPENDPYLSFIDFTLSTNNVYELKLK